MPKTFAVRVYAAGSDRLDRTAMETAGIWQVRDALEVALAADLFDDPVRALARALDAAGPFASLDLSVRA